MNTYKRFLALTTLVLMVFLLFACADQTIGPIGTYVENGGTINGSYTAEIKEGRFFPLSTWDELYGIRQSDLQTIANNPDGRPYTDLDPLIIPQLRKDYISQFGAIDGFDYTNLPFVYFLTAGHSIVVRFTYAESPSDTIEIEINNVHLVFPAYPLPLLWHPRDLMPN